MHQNLRLALPVLMLLPLAACGDDPVEFSEPVTINLKAKSGDVVNNALDDEKNINTESSNPYAKFVTDARAALGGADPSRIELAKTTLLLGGTSTGVTGLGQVFTGQVDVQFTANDTNTTFPAAGGSIAAVEGAGPIELGSIFTTDGIASADFAKIVDGNFKVTLRGPAAAGFAAAGADADLQLTFTFSAFE